MGRRALVDGGSGQLPGSVSVGQAEGQESAQVESGETVVEPGVVLSDAAVGHSTVASYEPGDRPFHHGPVGAVAVLEGLVLRAGPMSAQERLVLMDLHRAAAAGCGAPLAKRTAAAGDAEGYGSLRA